VSPSRFKNDPHPGSTSTHDWVAATLRSRIKHGELEPGRRLVEADLVKELGASRSTIRTVLGQLATEGFVTIERNAGARVRDLDPEGISQLYEVRATLEGRAAGLVASRIDHGDYRTAISRFLTENEHFSDAVPVSTYWKFNENLHQTILDCAGNAMLAQLAEKARTLTYHYHLQASSIEHPDGLLSIDFAATQHRSILACILAGNADAAEVAMREHIRHNGSRVVAHFAAAIEL
jgi:DNA-binding GntR family transcriptional regulator